MGMYTGFVCKIKVKEKYYDLVQFLNDGEYEFRKGLWETACDKFGYKFVKEFMVNNRSDFIPRGGCSAYNEDWLEEYILEDSNSFEKGIWFFGCDMKNYDNTIEDFVQIVLPEITEEVYFVKSHYEEDEEEDENYEILYTIPITLDTTSTCKHCGAPKKGICKYCGI